MLNIFKRNRRPAPVSSVDDPLKIRNLLDDPRLQAVMASTTDGGAEPVPISAQQVDRRERALLGAAA